MRRVISLLLVLLMVFPTISIKAEPGTDYFAKINDFSLKVDKGSNVDLTQMVRDKLNLHNDFILLPVNNGDISVGIRLFKRLKVQIKVNEESILNAEIDPNQEFRSAYLKRIKEGDVITVSIEGDRLVSSVAKKAPFSNKMETVYSKADIEFDNQLETSITGQQIIKGRLKYQGRELSTFNITVEVVDRTKDDNLFLEQLLQSKQKEKELLTAISSNKASLFYGNSIVNNDINRKETDWLERLDRLADSGNTEAKKIKSLMTEIEVLNNEIKSRLSEDEHSKIQFNSDYFRNGDKSVNLSIDSDRIDYNSKKPMNMYLLILDIDGNLKSYIQYEGTNKDLIRNKQFELSQISTIDKNLESGDSVALFVFADTKAYEVDNFEFETEKMVIEKGTVITPELIARYIKGLPKDATVTDMTNPPVNTDKVGNKIIDIKVVFSDKSHFTAQMPIQIIDTKGEYEAKINALSKEIEELKAQIENLKKENEALKNASSEDSRVKQLQDELSKLQAKNKELQSEIDKLNTDNINLNNEIKKLKEDAQNLNNEIESLKQQIKEKDNEINSLKSTIESKDAEIADLKAKLAKAQDTTEINNLRNQLQEKAEEIDSLKDKISKLETEGKANRNTISELNNKIVSLEKQLRELKVSSDQKIKDLEAKITEKDSKISELEEEISNKAKEIENLKAQLAAANNDEKIKLLMKQIADKDNEITALKRKINDLDAKYAIEKEKLNEELKKLEDLNAQISDAAKKASDELDKAKARVRDLEDLIKAKDNEIKRLKGIIDNADNSEILNELNKIKRENEELNKDLKEKIRELDSLALSNSQLKVLNERLTKSNDELKALINSLEKKLLDNESKIKSLEEEKAALSNYILKMGNANSNPELEKEIEKLKSQINEKDKEINKIKKQNNNLSHYEDTINKLKKENDNLINELYYMQEDKKQKESRVHDLWKDLTLQKERLNREIENVKKMNKKSETKDHKVTSDNININKDSRYSLYYVFTISNKGYIKFNNTDSQLQSMDVAPFVKDNRTMLPIRFIGQILGYEVNWDNNTKDAIFTKNGIKVAINAKDKEVEIRDNRIFVQATKLIQMFGGTHMTIQPDNPERGTINWNPATKSVVIYPNI